MKQKGIAHILILILLAIAGVGIAIFFWNNNAQTAQEEPNNSKNTRSQSIDLTGLMNEYCSDTGKVETNLTPFTFNSHLEDRFPGIESSIDCESPDVDDYQRGYLMVRHSGDNNRALFIVNESSSIVGSPEYDDLFDLNQNEPDFVLDGVSVYASILSPSPLGLSDQNVPFLVVAHRQIDELKLISREVINMNAEDEMFDVLWNYRDEDVDEEFLNEHGLGLLVDEDDISNAKEELYSKFVEPYPDIPEQIRNAIDNTAMDVNGITFID